jgi:hypothetical protein
MGFAPGFFAVLLLVASQPAPARQSSAPPKIEIVLATEPGIAPTVPGQWFQLFADLKENNLRIRAAGTADAPAITSAGRPEAPVYKVVGIVNRNGELLVPGGKFRITERAGLADWLKKLRTEGPERAKGAPRLPFGLSKDQFGQIHDDLARAIPFSTKGLKPADFVNRAADLVQHPLSGDAASAALLEAAEPIDAELRGLSVGTGLAYLLDTQGLALVPRLDARRQPIYAIGPESKRQQRWPMGWEAREPRRDLVPSLFDTVEVELTDVELSRILAAVGEHVPAPILVDRAALAGEKIDLAKVKMSLPAKRTMYDLVLRKVLVPNRLTHEVRVDEGHRPFLWITTARRAAEAKAKSKETEQ